MKDKILKALNWVYLRFDKVVIYFLVLISTLVLFAHMEEWDLAAFSVCFITFVAEASGHFNPRRDVEKSNFIANALGMITACLIGWACHMIG